MIGCVLLAGGKSSRMNGIDKALVRINNKTLLSIIINKLNFDKSNIVFGLSVNSSYLLSAFFTLYCAFV